MRTRYAAGVAVLCAAMVVVAVAGCGPSQKTGGTGEGLHSTVPDVSGLAQAAAEAKLEEAGYSAQVTTETAESTPEGSVVRQDPAAGTAVPRGSSVAIVVAAGPGSVEVPDVVGTSVITARAILSEAGLAAAPQDVTGNPNEVKVTRQQPAAGESAAPGSEVQIWAE